MLGSRTSATATTRFLLAQTFRNSKQSAAAMTTSLRNTSTTSTATTTTLRSHTSQNKNHSRRLLVRLQTPRQIAARSFSTTTTTTLAPPKPWNRNGDDMVESSGDYRAEAWLEQHIGGPLYACQKDLPHLPVPKIADTLERFLPTALPLAAAETSTNERQALLDAVAKFPKQAAVLQEKLQQRALDEKHSSWLQHWWNTLGYLDVRDSVVINVSYYFHFVDDSTVYGGGDSAVDNDPQIKRAAALLYTTAKVRNQVVTGSFPQEKIGKAQTPLCSTAYKYMFHACRIPHADRDTYRIYDPALYTHAAVACRGHLFAIPLVDGEKNTHQPISVEALESSLRECVQRAQHSASPPTDWTWLTTQNRDAWAAAHADLPPQAHDDMKMLESAACLICLDDDAVYTTDDMAHLLLYGGANSSRNDAASSLNRWFDKSLQIVVTRNGKAGFVGEHSMMDGMPVVSSFADQVSRAKYAACKEESTHQQQGNSAVPSAAVTPLFQNVPPPSAAMMDHIGKAKRAYTDWTGQHSIASKQFGVYGSNWIKSTAKISPDAYVQMAMQIATYRLWDGQQGGTYEATQVRPFLHGRTETTRTVSTESAALVARMGKEPLWHEIHDPAVRAEKLTLLRAAAVAHVKYIGNAAAGQGVDRHFLGLSMIASEQGLPLPDLYADPVFARSKTWRVSTSNLSHPAFHNWGYGQVTPTGVGLSYSIHPDRLHFSVTALKRPPGEADWTTRLCQHLEEALLELQTLVEVDAVEAADTPKSKL